MLGQSTEPNVYGGYQTINIIILALSNLNKLISKLYTTKYTCKCVEHKHGDNNKYTNNRSICWGFITNQDMRVLQHNHSQLRYTFWHDWCLYVGQARHIVIKCPQINTNECPRENRNTKLHALFGDSLNSIYNFWNSISLNTCLFYYKIYIVHHNTGTILIIAYYNIRLCR